MLVLDTERIKVDKEKYGFQHMAGDICLAYCDRLGRERASFHFSRRQCLDNFFELQYMANEFVSKYGNKIAVWGLGVDVPFLNNLAKYHGYDTFFEAGVKEINVYPIFLEAVMRNDGYANWLKEMMTEHLIPQEEVFGKKGIPTGKLEFAYGFVTQDEGFVKGHQAVTDVKATEKVIRYLAGLGVYLD